MAETKDAPDALSEGAIPRQHEVHCASEPPSPKPVPAELKRPVGQKSPAQWAYERLILYVKNFEEQLDSEHEVAMGFAGSDVGVMRIEGMGYFDPDIVTFYGSDPSGVKSQLIQHVTQLNVMLRALPKRSPDDAPSRIGFRLAADLEETSAQK